MKYETEKSFVDELDLDSEPLSIEEMNKCLNEHLEDGDWEEDFLSDDFDEIDRRVESFSVRIAELEEEFERLEKQTGFVVSDSGSFGSKLGKIKYDIEILEDKRGILIGHKEILEGKGIPNDEVFARIDRKLDAMILEKSR
jgi:hypothetical protein